MTSPTPSPASRGEASRTRGDDREDHRGPQHRRLYRGEDDED